VNEREPDFYAVLGVAPDADAREVARAYRRRLREAHPDTRDRLSDGAVSAQAEGLQPINQFGITYAGQVGYHDYDGPGLRPEERKKFVAALGDRKMMFMRNHGTLAWGRSIAEAFTLMHYLERSCEIQVAAQGGGALALPPQEVIARTVETAQGVGDASFGRIGFEALLRRLDREDPTYRA